MMAVSASRAAAHGPRGFSLASISTVSGPGFGISFRAWARASIGSVTMRMLKPAAATVERVRKERRDGEVKPELFIGPPREAMLAHITVHCLALLTLQYAFRAPRFSVWAKWNREPA